MAPKRTHEEDNIISEDTKRRRLHCGSLMDEGSYLKVSVSYSDIDSNGSCDEDEEPHRNLPRETTTADYPNALDAEEEQNPVPQDEGHSDSEDELAASTPQTPKPRMKTTTPSLFFRNPRSRTWEKSLLHSNPPSSSPSPSTLSSSSFIVYHRGGLTDYFLTRYLGNIARTLNFMVRAATCGIDTSNFDALALVSAEQWAEVGDVKTPDEAAAMVVETLLGLPLADINLLADKAAKLREELGVLGVVIE
ncbi:hypothetical protein GGR50DRAFT_239704 [Xylaria sp. CBS 124048]|nr:hypothetical protein GGR50DRAFT_239704 [Xylaria sp. CBS 124048]